MKSFTIDWSRTGTEFLVIVIGVLVALGVDQWWSDREDQRIEAEYLSRIREDIASDIDNFRRLEEIFSIKEKVTKDLRDYPDSDLMSGSPNELVRNLVYSGFVALPDSTSTTFDELVSTGRFALIQSIELRDSLSRYYSSFEHISRILFEPPGDYKKVLWESLPGELLIRGQTDDVVVNSEEFSSGIDLLLSDPRLKASANSEMVYANTLNYYLSGKRRQAEQLLELIDTT